MLLNYFKIALRNLLRHKLFSFINIFGLAVGLACCLLIALFIFQELSYDTYHANANRIYRVGRSFNGDDVPSLQLANIAPPFGPLLKNDFPAVEEATRLLQHKAVIAVSPQKFFTEENVFFAEPSFFKIFTVLLRSGTPQTALSEPNTILLTEKLVAKYFPKQNPIGQFVRLDNKVTLKVTGVFKDFPVNSHFHPNFLVSFSTLQDSTLFGRENLANFSINRFTTYLLVPPQYNVAPISAQLPAFLDRHIEYQNTRPSSYNNLFLQKLTDIHLHSHLDTELEPNGDSQQVYLFGVIALFILLIACINFMNLSTARSSLRAKEIGVRKVMGASQGKLMVQFLSESLLFVFIAVLLAVVLTNAALPLMNKLTGKELYFNPENGWLAAGVVLGLALLVGLVAGSYPALYLSSFQPVKVLKGKIVPLNRSVSLRKALVVLQFAISVVLVVSTAVVYKQLSYLQDKTLGLNKDYIVTLPYVPSLSARYQAFRNELLANNTVTQVARSIEAPSERLLNSWGEMGIASGGTYKEASVSFEFLGIDPSFVPTYKIKILAGRNFSEAYPTDSTKAFLLNESGVKALGFKSPQQALGSTIDYGDRQAKVVGVLSDFHFESMHQKIKPLLFMIPASSDFRYLSVKLAGADLKSGMAQLEKTWKQFLPDYPFEYAFLDQKFGRLYAAEQRQGLLFTLFAGMAILIACLGLFGLATFATEQRTKEIGIRKVLGASIGSIVALLSKDFLKLVLLANLLAWPIAWYGMHRWLQDFAYRTPLSWSTFGLATLLAVVIAVLTVSFQAIKAAIANPVEALRNE
ncbi:macrolide export ATP-binding/permease MacB [Adhaeribacter arboris]|uniref:Macrolide export ATP-binding/permease MacB n=1 Tax=Adhaeribacter arboris TaxID=2072846 RepID=A0A2T2YIK4_9BACT|nr:ABC transporter permease [Adhaeribacter arboris]PSR55343.1 macrolide export ATP-binding/permease MacB [Adhaeribacter arboris]